MPLISIKDQELLEPLSEQVAERLRNINIRINRYKLREFAFARAKEAIFLRNPSWEKPGTIDPAILDAQIEIDVKLDYTQDLYKLCKEFLRVFRDGGGPLTQEQQDELRSRNVQVHKELFEKEIVEDIENRDIDKAVATGGRTKLHLAAEAGDLAECKRLVEVEHAKVSIKDNSNFTPKRRAEFGGHEAVVEYLANFS